MKVLALESTGARVSRVEPQIGILFQWFGMCLQVSMAVLAGLGSYLAKGGAPASAQVLTIAGIKLVWAVVLVVCNPCACGLTNAVIAGQCLSEGVASILLWAASVGLIDAAKVRLKMITFMLLLVPVFIPIFQKVYDGLVSLCKLRKKKANKVRESNSFTPHWRLPLALHPLYTHHAALTRNARRDSLTRRHRACDNLRYLSCNKDYWRPMCARSKPRCYQPSSSCS